MFNFPKNPFLNLSAIFLASLLILSGCEKQKKSPEEMKAEELKKTSLAFIEQKKGEDAIEHLEKLVVQYPEDSEISKYKLLLADEYLNDGKLESAHQMYNNFKDFYPADEKAEYATYKSILAKFYQTLKVDCDQTETQEAIKLCKNYLNTPFMSEYKNDVIDIKNTCQQKLIDKEVYVYDYYLKRKKFDAANNRLKYLRNSFLKENPILEARLLYLEAKLADKKKDKDGVAEKLENLVNKYPESQFTKMAKGLMAKENKPFKMF